MPFHTVVYAETADGVQSGYQRSYKDWLVDRWLEENCQAPYYHSPGWTMKKYIQFESSEDAVHFALRWAQ
jgi:hypothetical protein